MILTIFIKTVSFISDPVYEYEYESGPCGKYTASDGDLNTFDMIRGFNLEEKNSIYDSIEKIEGTNILQTAYRLERDTNLTMHTYQAFPHGIPHQFSFECTYRSREKSQDPWYLFHLSNSYEEAQMYIKMNPLIQTIEISLPQVNGDLQVIEFEHTPLFNEAWHKVMIAVTHEKASLWVDCQQVKYTQTSYDAQLAARGFFDTSGGYVSIARFVEESTRSSYTAEVDLQWLIISCDALRPSRENCDELPVKISIININLV